jgi:hypothetical protein
MVLLAAAIPSSAISEHREHGTHEHGVAEFNIALAEATVTLELHSPAYNIFGFEHSPNTAEQQQAVTERLATLKKATALFEFDPKAACVLLTTDIQNPFETAKANKASAESHEHDAESHEHAESHEPDEAEHTDIELTYRYRCSEAVNSLDIQGLLTQFPYFDTLKVQWVSDTQQSAQTVTKKNSRIQFK